MIDLVELQLLPNFFALEFEFYTTSLVFEELEEDQQFSLKGYVDAGNLPVRELTHEQLAEINNIQKIKPALSPQDCSAFYQAQIEGGILITSDNTLRNFAKAQNQEVHGHLWVFERMFEAKTISGELAINKLNELCQAINRNLGLPQDECQKRILQWQG